MKIKCILIILLLIFADNIKASISPCTPVYPFVQKSQGSSISIESIPWSPNTSVTKGKTRVYYNEKLLYSLDFYLFNEYVITDSSGFNLVLLDNYRLKYFQEGRLVKEITSYHILSTSTRDSLNNKYLGISDVSSSYFLDHGIPGCEIAKKKRRKITLNPNDLIVEGNTFYFRTIENKWIEFNLEIGEIEASHSSKPDINSTSIQRNYKFLKYPDLKKVKTEVGILLSEEIANKLNMTVADYDSNDLKLAFDISLDKSGAILPESELRYFYSRHKLIMDELELKKEELNGLIRKMKLRVKIPKELPLYHSEFVIYLKKSN